MRPDARRIRRRARFAAVGACGGGLLSREHQSAAAADPGASNSQRIVKRTSATTKVTLTSRVLLSRVVGPLRVVRRPMSSVRI